MIKSHLDDLLQKKAATENRKITLRIVAEETELSVNTIQRLKTISSESVHYSTLDKLCRYFQVTINDLIEYTPDASECL